MAWTIRDADSALVGRICVVSAALLWSTSGAFAKSLTLPPTNVAMYRTLFAGSFLLLIMALRRVRPTWNFSILAMASLFAVMNYVFIASMKFTTAANSIFLQYSAPFWMTLGSVFLLGEATTRRQTIALGGTLVGVAVIVIGNLDDWRGVSLGLLSGFCYASVALFLRALRGVDSLWLTAVNHLTAGLALAAVLLALSGLGTVPLGELAFPTDPRQGLLLALFGIAQMGFPYLLFGMGLKRISPQEAGILTLIEPVLNPVWTYTFVGEVPTSATLIGGALLILALALRYLPSGRFPPRVDPTMSN